MLLLTIFLIIPLTEITLFALAGQLFGVFPTLLLCVISAVFGSFLIRTQGFHTLFSARAALARHELPVRELFDGMCLTLAGLLLITPGFFTDALGFLLLAPPVRLGLRRYLARRFEVDTAGFDSYTIEGEYRRVENKDDEEQP